MAAPRPPGGSLHRACGAGEAACLAYGPRVADRPTFPLPAWGASVGHPLGEGAQSPGWRLVVRTERGLCGRRALAPT